MKGVAKHTEAIIEKVSLLECIKSWTLVGGTALAIQLDHRKSEDLDFMRWQSQKGERMDVNWPAIRKQLETVGEIHSVDILDHNHIEFIVSGVKISFYAREGRSPVKTTLPFLNNIQLADINAIATMKLEVMLRRSKFRDYYDLFCIFQQDPDVMKFVKAAGDYSNHLLKSKHFLAMLTNHRHFEEDRNFEQLGPRIAVTPLQIEEYIKGLLKKSE
ncbi:nucleotidyl transferase AbiEii/AbiGii toxin family protein [Alistipes sp.]|uniref:nucleotidyl transferase AbiEii/AbiGii toxin family protein n=1 Tax=Alistipes sp. TaxID=1872444 RepID=UPI003AEF5476